MSRRGILRGLVCLGLLSGILACAILVLRAHAERPPDRVFPRTSVLPVASGPAVPERTRARPAAISDGTGPLARADAAATEGSPYPWSISAEARQALQGLAKGVRLSFSYHTLREALDELGKAAGVRIDLAPEVTTSRRLQGHAFEMSAAADVLERVVGEFQLVWDVGDDGVVRVGRIGAVILRPEVAICRTLEQVRTLPGVEEKALADHLDAARKADERLRSLRIVTEAGETDLAAVLQRIEKETGQWVSLDLPPDSQPVPVRLGAGVPSLDLLLAGLAEQTGLEMAIFGGRVGLRRPEDAARRREHDERWMGRVRAVLDARVQVAEPQIDGRALVGFLEQETGRKVVVSEEVWNRREPLVLLSGTWRLEEALRQLELQNGLHWRMREGVIYVY